MRPSLRLLIVLGTILTISCFSTSVHARRRSRIDSPIENAADAPLEDNIATASDVDSARSEEFIETTNEPRSSSDAAAESAVVADSVNECNPENVSFELVTGYVFSGANELLESVPGTLLLTDCLEQCNSHENCSSVNYETGLCVLFSSNADKLDDILRTSFLSQMFYRIPKEVIDKRSFT